LGEGLEEFKVYFEYPSGKVLVNLLEVLGALVDEVLFNFSEDSLTIKALDPAQVALIKIQIPASSFLSYDVKSALSVGVNLSDVLKSLPRPKKGDKLTFKADESFFEFFIESITSKRFKYRSIEVSSAEIPEELNVKFNVRASVVAKAFKDAIEDLKGGGTLVFESLEKQHLIIKATDIKAEAKLSLIGGSLLELEVDEPSKSSYDEEYLAKVIHLADLTDTLKVEFSTDSPLRLVLTMPSGELVEYLQAPKA